MIDKKYLGNKIKELRLVSGKSQTELGKFLGKSHAAVSDIERGITDVTVKDLSLIASYFNVPVDDLIREVQVSTNVSFKPLMNFRDAKDMTEVEQKKADEVSQSFIDFVKGQKDDISQ